MKKLLLILLCVPLIFSCGEKTEKSEEKTSKKRYHLDEIFFEDGRETGMTHSGIAKLKKDSSILNGIYYDEHQNGQLKFEMNYEEGKLHGICKYYNFSGDDRIHMQTEQGYYLNGKKDSLWIRYHSAPYQKQVSDFHNYKDGELHGLSKSYYNDGSISWEYAYKKGIRHELWTNYYRNGKLKLKKNWDNNGKLKSQINYSENGIKTISESNTVSYYICYNEDNDLTLNLSIGFSINGNALSVKYQGMNSSMDLIFIKEENKNPGGPYPVLVSYYNEIYNEKVNGEYKLTHSGIWDLVEYTRGKDLKKFNFTIDRNSNSYSYNPCF